MFVSGITDCQAVYKIDPQGPAFEKRENTIPNPNLPWGCQPMVEKNLTLEQAIARAEQHNKDAKERPNFFWECSCFVYVKEGELTFHYEGNIHFDAWQKLDFKLQKGDAAFFFRPFERVQSNGLFDSNGKADLYITR